ncbi:5-bromo-4-chloroindolyl phosphate hydrolysis family protein [Thiocapsa bogorovii]|uniref:5-bromo-4-chloroindolyl phosphate hydrolysis family protein n=1 Tax=Thiocapsa bogorovii TaxID=521689 RepID=UPI001E41C2EB|nr:5-bromo-4-chloroindolyl phosphate hydrolysis family protein [Thiocapsa bogorovii]UHD17242.1 5-bromo-4-chloroindolyl phosphate hydrolysis family protein [Thiocapsa bogorovii]
MVDPTGTTPEQRRTLGLTELILGVKPVRQSGSEQSAGWARRPRARGTLLYVLPIPLLIGALIGLGAGRLDVVLADGGVFAIFMAAADLTRRGLKAESAQQILRFTRLQRVPLKTIGGLLTGLATGLAAVVSVHQGLGLGLAYAAVAMLGFHLLYGFEPLGRPRAFATNDERSRKIAAALAEAERKLIDLDRAAKTIANPELKIRLQRIGSQGRSILDQIADRPTDLFRARKFLSVYLDGVQQVADGYARTHRLADSRELEQNFRNVLVTVEQVFDEQHQRLLKTDVMDLDIQIEVLKKQLEREGIQ